jgi:hypothetical protein
VCDTSSDAAKGQCVDCNTDGDCTFGTCQTATHLCSSPPAIADAGQDAGRDAGHVAGRDAGREAGGKKMNADAGTPVPSSSGGCTCRAAPSRSGAGARGAFGLLLAAGLAIGRRKRMSGGR